MLFSTWAVTPKASESAKWHSGYPTKKAAEEARTDLLGHVDKGEYVAPNRLTVKDFAETQWLPSIEALVAGGNMRPSTAAGYRIQVNSYVISRLGGVLLRDLSAPMLNKLYAELLISGRRRSSDGPKGLSPTSVHMVHVTIHRMLKDAVRWNLVARETWPISPTHHGRASPARRP